MAPARSWQLVNLDSCVFAHNIMQYQHCFSLLRCANTAVSGLTAGNCQSEPTRSGTICRTCKVLCSHLANAGCCPCHQGNLALEINHTCIDQAQGSRRGPMCQVGG